MTPTQLFEASKEKRNFKTIYDRYKIADQLERKGHIKLGNDEITLLPGHLVQIKGNEPLISFSGYLLENPMTWDTFVHLYLLDK